MKILVLTDHKTHRDGESIYPLLREMANDNRCESIIVASRSVTQNNEYFNKCQTTKLTGKPVNNNFTYTENGELYFNGDEINARDFDVIFLRIDRPREGSLGPFLHHVESNSQNSIVINRPSGILATGSKNYLLNYPDLCPEMRLCKTMEDIRNFAAEKSIVLKPLESYGGKGIIRIIKNRIWFEDHEYDFDKKNEVLEKYLKNVGPYLGMEFLENNHLGDKRIVVVNGKVMGATLRYPKEGSWLCNLSKGGSAGAAAIDDEEMIIASTISQDIVRHGVVIFGFDTLVNNEGKRVLSEINTLNVGGLYEAGLYSGLPVISRSSDLILTYCEKRRKTYRDRNAPHRATLPGE